MIDTKIHFDFRAIALFIVACAIALPLGFQLVKTVYIRYFLRWEYSISNQDFNQYYDDFETIVKLAERYQEKGQSDAQYMMEGHDNGVIYLSYQGERIHLSEQESESLKNIESAFNNPDADFDGIRIYANRISFEIANGQYALVYSADNSKPTFVNVPSEKYGVYVKKIREHWYHVVRKAG